MRNVFAFAFIVKSFAIIFLVFFFLFFLFLVLFLDGLPKPWLTSVLKLVIKKAWDQDLAHSLDTSKNISAKIVQEVVICDVCFT